MAGAGGGERVSVARGTGSAVPFAGEGGSDMGRQCRVWWRSVQQERWERGLGELWPHLGEQVRYEWGLGSGQAPWSRGERESRGQECLPGGGQQRCRLWEQAPLWGKPGHPGGVGGAWGSSRSAAGYWGQGGQSPALHGYAA